MSVRILVPLCIDLDGTFIQEDVTRIAFKKAAADHWWYYVKVLQWFLQGGRSKVKFHLAQLHFLNKSDITLNPELYEFLRQQHSQGRILILATGATERHAQMIVEMYPFFSEIVSSSETFNCVAHNKAQVLVEKYGVKGFDYAGNSRQDLAVWTVCREPVAVNCSLALIKKVSKISGRKVQTFDVPKNA